MGIDLRWEDEFGKELKSLGDPRMLMSHLVLSVDLEDTICLRFLDPYGDTVFNQSQIPILIEEIRRVSQRIEDRDISEHVERLIAVAVASQGETRTYLKFYGD